MMWKGVGVCALVLGVSSAAMASAEFTVTLENIGVQPLTPVFLATHDMTFDIFDEGAAASPALEALAEDGVTGLLEADAASAAGVLDFGVGGFIFPGESTTVTLMADAAHPYLSFAAMLPVTNDAFIGGAYMDNALALYRGGAATFYDFTLSFLEVWDAGTEVNTESADDVPALSPGTGSPVEGGVVTKPHTGILGVGDVPPEFDFWGTNVARITIVPEPTTLALLAFGAVAAIRRRR